MEHQLGKTGCYYRCLTLKLSSAATVHHIHTNLAKCVTCCKIRTALQTKDGKKIKLSPPNLEPVLPQ